MFTFMMSLKSFAIYGNANHEYSESWFDYKEITTEDFSLDKFLLHIDFTNEF